MHEHVHQRAQEDDQEWQPSDRQFGTGEEEQQACRRKKSRKDGSNDRPAAPAPLSAECRRLHICLRSDWGAREPHSIVLIGYSGPVEAGSIRINPDGRISLAEP